MPLADESMCRVLSILLIVAAISSWRSATISAEERTSNSENTQPHASSQTSPTQPPNRLTTRDRSAARRAAREAARNEKQRAERQQWLTRLALRDVEPWPAAESENDHATALARSREMVDEVRKLLPGTELYETERF